MIPNLIKLNGSFPIPGKYSIYQLIGTLMQLAKFGLGYNAYPDLTKIVRQVLNRKHLVVCGYSGWDSFDVMLGAVFPKFKCYLKVQPSLFIRKMSTRWGSCTPSGRIILNPELIKARKGCIEYVIIHELCHLVHYNHTRQFYRLLGRILPDWEKWKDRLNNIDII